MTPGAKKISSKGLTVEVALPKIPLLRKGAIAQLGERYNGIVEVSGSIPLGSTIPDTEMRHAYRMA